MTKDQYDKEILRTLKSISANLSLIAKNLNSIDGNIRYFNPSNIEPHTERITTDLLAEKLIELEDIVNDDEFIVTVAIEEMSELTQCLTKYLRANDKNHTYDFDHLHEEFADVLVCMNHLKSIFGFETQETRKRMLEKLDRAIERSK